MRDSDSDNGPSGITSRRNVLRTAGLAAAATVGGASVVSADRPSDVEARYHEAVEKREKSGKHKVFVRYLENHGFDVDTAHYETQIDRSNGDYSAEYDDPESNPSGFSVDIVLSNHCNKDNRMFVDYYWTFHDVDPRNSSDATDTHVGFEPHDTPGIYWSSTDYSRITDTEYSGSYCLIGGGYGDYDPNGIVWEYQDRKHYMDKQEANNYDYEGDISSYAGCQVARESPSDPAYKRAVQIDYYHTYNSCSISSVSVGSGGVSISGSCDTNRWGFTKEKGEQEVDFVC